MKRNIGKRPGELSAALKSKLEASAQSSAEPGLRVQLARSISMVFAPSGYKAPAEAGSVPEDSLELEYVHGYGGQEHACESVPERSRARGVSDGCIGSGV